MANLHIVFILSVCTILLLEANGNKVAKFRVYVKQFGSGPNATLYEVARANITADSATSFGIVRVVDDFMTSGPDMNTENLGRVQGLEVYTGLTEFRTMLTLNFVFAAGKYNGSTITVLGQKQHLSILDQELPIIGGTAAFRLARGYVISNVYSYDVGTDYLVVIFDFFVYK